MSWADSLFLVRDKLQKGKIDHSHDHEYHTSSLLVFTFSLSQIVSLCQFSHTQYAFISIPDYSCSIVRKYFGPT